MAAQYILARLAADEMAEIAEGKWIFGIPDGMPWTRIVKCHPPEQCGSADFVIGPTSADAPYNPIDYLSRYASAGCAAVMLDRVPAGLTAGLPVLQVPRIRRALFRLARRARKDIEGRIVAVTGSSGKTTTKDMLAFLLSRQGTTIASPGTGNSLMAICYQLINAPLGGNHYVFESGLGQGGSGIADQSSLLRPHVAIVTAVHPAHAAGYESVEDIVRSKMDICRHLQPEGQLLIDRDSEHYALMLSLADHNGVKQVRTFGFHPEADIRVAHVAMDEGGTSAQIMLGDTTRSVRLRMHGEHWAKIGAAALGASLILGLDIDRAANDLADFQMPSGRGQVYPLPFNNGELLIFDSHYNANPGSMAADLDAFAVMAAQRGQRCIGVIGAMRELGDLTESAHRELASRLAGLSFSHIFLIGEETRVMSHILPSPGTQFFEKLDAALPVLTSHLKAGDFVFIKGSHSNRLDLLVKHLRSLR